MPKTGRAFPIDVQNNDIYKFINTHYAYSLLSQYLFMINMISSFSTHDDQAGGLLDPCIATVQIWWRSKPETHCLDFWPWERFTLISPCLLPYEHKLIESNTYVTSVESIKFWLHMANEITQKILKLLLLFAESKTWGKNTDFCLVITH